MDIDNAYLPDSKINYLRFGAATLGLYKRLPTHVLNNKHPDLYS